MTTYTGTQNVEPGLYINFKKFTVMTMDEGGPLPGAETDTWRRAPLLLVLATAPLAGLAFVMFLPFIGFAMVAYLLGDKAIGWAGNAVTEMVRVVRPGWVPALAFLVRTKPVAKDEARPADAAPDAWQDQVEQQLNDRKPEA